MKEKIKGALFGLAIGDALGVPVEFNLREDLKAEPVTNMRGYGTWRQSPGTWSDDSSLAFCLAEGLTKGYDLKTVAQNFIAWYKQGYWGAHHKVFDVGNATSMAIVRLMRGTEPALAGGTETGDNGNGSLMRIMPLLFHVKNLDVDERYRKVKEVSSITHAHFRSVFACFIYIEMSVLILKGYPAKQAYAEMKNIVKDFCSGKDFSEYELGLFDRVLTGDISGEEERAIRSDGYVLHTLEASLWCILNTNDYAGAVLKAVNLGGDTDTTACITGGMGGLLYGYESIPADWLSVLARKTDIDDLCSRLYEQMNE